jgi:phospholipid/cholesterol/gamma-HCH transport system substrate-binding protein
VKISKELKVGLTVIVAVAFIIFGINFLKGVNLFKNNRTFTAKYSEVDGLVTASPVIYKGMKVGQVTAVDIINGGEYIEVTFVIDNDDIKIPVDTKATIFSADLLGTRAINLDFGTSKEIAEPGHIFKGDKQASIGDRVNQEIAPVKKKAEELLGSIDTLVTIIKTVIGDNKTGLDASVKSMQRTIASLQNTAISLETFIADEKGKISVILSKIQSFASNLAANNEKLNSIIDNTSKITGDIAKADLTQTIKKLNTTLDNINGIIDGVNRGEGSLGKLIKTDSLHNELIAISQKVQNLIDNITQHPTRYLHFSVFGAKEKGLKLSSAEEKQLKQLLKQPL